MSGAPSSGLREEYSSHHNGKDKEQPLTPNSLFLARWTVGMCSFTHKLSDPPLLLQEQMGWMRAASSLFGWLLTSVLMLKYFSVFYPEFAVWNLRTRWQFIVLLSKHVLTTQKCYGLWLLLIPGKGKDRAFVFKMLTALQQDRRVSVYCALWF